MLIVIDSLRADKFYGNSKTAVTPNIDLLIKKGVNFTQAICSSDGTFTSIGSIFSAMFPSKSGLTTFSNQIWEKFFRYFKRY